MLSRRLLAIAAPGRAQISVKKRDAPIAELRPGQA
jgi:hypothetical protein